MKYTETEHPLNILVIGTGMYVSGRNTDQFGTILPAICEWTRQGHNLGQVFIASTNAESTKIVRKKLKQLNMRMGTHLEPHYFPESGGKRSDWYKQALKIIPKPACAIVVVPDHLHTQISGDCLKMGLHTLVVKPLAPTVQEAKKLIQLQESRNLYGAVEFHKRFDRANLKLKEIIAQKNIGLPLYFIVEYSQRKSVPSKIFASWVKHTNPFQFLGVHYVDIIHFATEAVPARVMALGQKGWLHHQGIPAYDAVHSTIEWRDSNGGTFFSFFFTNWIDPEHTSAMSDQRIKMIGTEGRFESNQKSRGILSVTDAQGIEEINPDFCSSSPTSTGKMAYTGYGIESLHTFFWDVMGLLEKKCTLEMLESKRSTFKNSLPSTAAVEAVNKSLNREGTWIDIVY